jgi:signal transduction histidine kinase
VNRLYQVPIGLRADATEYAPITKDVGKGTGLGLHLSYRIVTQRHHGSLTVRSLPGETRMIVRIPVEEEP